MVSKQLISYLLQITAMMTSWWCWRKGLFNIFVSEIMFELTLDCFFFIHWFLLLSVALAFKPADNIFSEKSVTISSIELFSPSSHFVVMSHKGRSFTQLGSSHSSCLVHWWVYQKLLQVSFDQAISISLTSVHMADCDLSSWFKSMTLFFGGTAPALGAYHGGGSPH